MDEHLTTTIQQRITAFWSLIAPRYESDPANMPAYGTPEYHGWVRLFERLFPPSPVDVLGVGTGTGFVALIAASLGHRVTGVDLANDMLQIANEQAKSRGPGIQFVEADAVDPPFDDESFDVVANRYLLWTLREPERAIGNWLRLLRPEGRVVTISGFWFAGPPETESEDSEERKDVFARYYTPQTQAALPGMRLRTHAEAGDMFERAGFRDITVEDVPAALVVEPEARPFVLVARRG